MISALVFLLVIFPAYFIYKNIVDLRANIAAAKQSGLPYSVAPWAPYNRAWFVSYRLWVPLLRRLPKSWTEDWLNYMPPDWAWELGYDGMKLGDNFLVVSPGMIILHTSDPSVIHHICSRREQFPKPLVQYAILNIFGRNLVTTEGPEWRIHRKVLSPSFNEKNNAMVFKEAVYQAKSMLRKWMGKADGEGVVELGDMQLDAMRLALHVISRVGLGLRLLWPGDETTENSDVKQSVYNSLEPSEGHSMSFEGALSTLLENVAWVHLVPGWILKRLPLKPANLAHESYTNWKKYMSELFVDKLDETRRGKHGDGMDIMRALAMASVEGQALGPSPSPTEKAELPQSVLSNAEVMGNTFIFILAGHETTADSIHFSVLHLAMNPGSQVSLHKDVDEKFGTRDPDEWNYEEAINKLFGGMVGATFYELLRIMPPVIRIPKCVAMTQDQVITSGSQKCILPKGTYISLNVVGVQRNPKHWPTKPSERTNKGHDLDDFIPERWFRCDAKADTRNPDDSGDEDENEFGAYAGTSNATIPTNLFRPVPGSFIPFSEGARSCLGRRIAQTEVTAVLATIFQRYSVELDVSSWASDDEVRRMGSKEKKVLYAKAARRAEETLKTASMRLTFKLHDEPRFVPMKLVPRGRERFVGFV
ncbi:hypothetical protein NW759_015329 [Fusarium solani]|uniref:Cytochrome P450 monooxygenase-like protein n=1 Tax=Fusarium solani TaxID=169388 RepID=A0A9P9G3V2_FUSSL|nr:cytochrome P450 monooxygenase-like protein [Fusarium solani]KAH7231527.1 cytochrome P450 monooxygenase-like protein [Fusarium solani]KAJ4202679.1 hypothetical protein NW759_015329 [Fusarium solani]